MIHFSGGEMERRQYQRLRVPQLYARIGDSVFHSVEWSFGGLVVEDPSGKMSPGALVRIDGLVDEDAYRQAHPPAPVDIRARVVRLGPAPGQAALSCLKIDDAAYGILRAVMGGLTSRVATPAE